MSSDLDREIERGEDGGRIHRTVLRLKAWSHRHPVLRVLHTTGVAVLGGLLVLAGLVMLITPGPGWLAIFLGIGVWGTEFAWAHHLNRRVKGRALHVWRWWSNVLAERRFRRAREKPPRLEQGPRHLRAQAPQRRRRAS